MAIKITITKEEECRVFETSWFIFDKSDTYRTLHEDSVIFFITNDIDATEYIQSSRLYVLL